MTDEARRAVRLITRLNIGGPARQALALTRELTPEWHTVLGAGTPTADEGELSDPAVHVTRLPLVRPLRPQSDARALAATRRLLRAERPDLVHTHMAKAGTIGRLALTGVHPRPRTIHTFHGHVLDGYFRPAVQRAFVEMERLLAHRTDVLVAVSDEVRDDLLALRIGRPDQYRVIRLGLDLDAHLAVRGRSHLLRSRLGLDDTTPLIGAVGRLVPIKDVTLLIRAAEQLPGVHVAIVGDGQLRTELETQAAPLRDRVHFIGWETDIPAVMADLDLAVLTSRNEGTPVSLIEAAAAGVAAVATDVGGVSSVVLHKKTGLLVPSGDATAFASSVRQLLDDHTLRARMGAAARSSASRFQLTRLVTDVRALYDELVPAAPRQ